MPKLSIITINLNNIAGLQKTFESVFEQTFKDFEYIVIDGGSTDASKEIIEKKAAKFSYWVSEKDKGIYNAMNKGIVKAKGEYIYFLNSGDYLINNEVLDKVFTEAESKDIIYGDVIVADKENPYKRVCPKELPFSYFIYDSLSHQGTFIKRDLFIKWGLYNEHLKIVADWEFFMLAINKHNCTYKHIPVIIASYNLDGVSAQKQNEALIQKEREEVLQKHFSAFLPEYARTIALQKELNDIKKMLGYRIHRKLLKITGKN